jgi:predicted dienelactone hydrolase
MTLIFDVFNLSRRYLIIGATLTTIVMEGCSTSPKQPEIDNEKIKQLASRGYDSGIAYATSITKSSLNTGNGFCQITIIQPSREGKYPLVIYMPGLGESSDAGADMRNAWAKSGYVVLSLQPLDDDVNIWSSKAARRGDFTFIRHERYSSGVISERLNALKNLIEYLKQRVGSGDSAFQHIDLSSVAIVGFDIGASSAMIVAGETVPNTSIARLPVHITGAIALSPYADFSGSEFDTRYRNINMPVLSVTSETDSDAHENVPPSLHQVPFQYMPPRNKYLLLLVGASHSVIGNDNSAKFDDTEKNGNAQQTRHDSTSEGSGRGRSNRRGKKSSNSGSDPELPAKRETVNSPTQRAIMGVAIEQVTTAFLNAYIKKDQLSLEWLNKDAGPWLAKIGQLKEK